MINKKGGIKIILLFVLILAFAIGFLIYKFLPGVWELLINKLMSLKGGT